MDILVQPSVSGGAPCYGTIRSESTVSVMVTSTGPNPTLCRILRHIDFDDETVDGAGSGTFCGHGVIITGEPGLSKIIFLNTGSGQMV